MKNRPPISFLLFFGGVWTFLLIHLGIGWWGNPQYGYGLFVPGLCIWILWQRRSELVKAFAEVKLSSGKQAPLRLGFFLYMIAVGLFPLELFRQVSPSLRSIGILGAVLCFILTISTLKQLGLKPIPKVVWGVSALFATSILWPMSFEQWMMQSLMRKIASVTADILNYAGILAVQRGNLIEAGTGIISINEACSGIRSLQSCLMVSIALGQFFALQWSRAWILLGLGILIALIGNLLRTLILTSVTVWRGPSISNQFHDPAGLSILLVSTLCLYVFANKWQTPRLESQGESLLIDWRRIPSAKVCCILAMTSIFAAHFWFWSREAYWPLQTEPFFQLKSSSTLKVETLPVPASILGQLKPHRGNYYRTSSLQWGEIAIYSFFWLPGDQNFMAFAHRPDLCMLGSGWSIAEPVREIKVPIDGQETLWHLFSFQRDGKKIWQAWGIWRDGIPQDLNFSEKWLSMAGQYLQFWRYIWQGRLTANVEVVSLIVDSRYATAENLDKIIAETFTTKTAGKP